MPKPISMNPKLWTYGCEHEFGDWDTRYGWSGYGRDPEPNIMNSNGIAGDPTLRDYPFGAEINTPPTSSPTGQAELLSKFLKRFPNCYVSHRVGMHVHIRIPGLIDNLPLLKRIQRYVSKNTAVYPLIDPLPYPDPNTFNSPEEVKASRRWIQYLRKSHWTTIPWNRVENQLRATTTSEFFALEAPSSKTGQPLYHAQPRASVNLRQLKQTDTIEFRPFLQTMDPEHVLTCVEWCRDYLLSAIDNYPAVNLFYEKYHKRQFPPLPEYIHWQQLRWEATSHSKQDRQTIQKNIQSILCGKFDSIPIYNL